MKHLSLILLLFLLGSNTAFGADLQKGFDAHERGDYATALKEWTPLAEQGYAAAQYNLAQMYRTGQGVPQDYKTAVKWYTPAAEQGIALAQANLAQMYRKGQGVPQDDKTSVKWYTLAAEQGHALAQYNLGVMYGNGKGVIQDNVYAHMWWDIAASSGDESASENRGRVAEIMTPADISAAQKLTRECVAKNYKGC
jgi:TPR repeat protein